MDHFNDRGWCQIPDCPECNKDSELMKIIVDKTENPCYTKCLDCRE